MPDKDKTLNNPAEETAAAEKPAKKTRASKPKTEKAADIKKAAEKVEKTGKAVAEKAVATVKKAKDTVKATRAKREELKAEQTAAKVEEAAAEVVEAAAVETAANTADDVTAKVVIELADKAASAESLVQRAKDDWVSKGNNIADMKELALYINASEGMVYYVVNDDYLSGSFAI